MKKLILVINDSDACGKSTLTTVLSEYLDRKQIKTTVALTSSEQESALPLDVLDLEEGVEPGELVGLIDQAAVLIIDVHTGGLNDLGNFFKRYNVDEVLAEIETELTVVVPVCDDHAVVHGAMEVVSTFANNADYLVVRMPLAADIPEAWGGGATQRAFKLLDAVEIGLPAVASAILDELDELELNIPLALTQRDLIPRYVRNELLAWEIQCAEQLAPVCELLIPCRSSSEDLRADSVFGKTLSI